MQYSTAFWISRLAGDWVNVVLQPNVEKLNKTYSQCGRVLHVQVPHKSHICMCFWNEIALKQTYLKSLQCFTRYTGNTTAQFDTSEDNFTYVNCQPSFIDIFDINELFQLCPNGVPYKINCVLKLDFQRESMWWGQRLAGCVWRERERAESEVVCEYEMLRSCFFDPTSRFIVQVACNAVNP